ncbi:MAG: hypothetical protein ACLVJB_03790 [Christensenellales bacterium]
MNALHAGLMCTLLLVGTIAGLFGCMSAVRCHRRFAFAICLAITLLDFVPLAVLLSNLPTDETLCPILWTAALLLTALSLFASLMLWWKGKRQLSPISIKESCDHLPCALCFAWENGQPCLKNLKMDELSHLLTGEALLNANTFWKTIESQPIVTLENGHTWSFARVRMTMAGRTVYQITGTNITEEARLQHELEKDNLRLEAMNRRLRQYGQDVQEATREKEILRAKTRVHDEIGRVLMQTRQFSPAHRATRKASAPGGRIPGFCWQNMPMNSIRTRAAYRAAQAIGVTIARSGAFPRRTESAQLAEAAAHECLTNLVRHAGGTRLEILSERTAEGWSIRYRNDGDAPSGPIVEGSGLTALRARTEAAGGAMAIAHAPRFELTLTLPQERQETL